MVQNGFHLAEVSLTHLVSPDDPEPALDLWWRQHPRRYVGGPLDGQRTDSTVDTYRPTVSGKVQTPDGLLDGFVPAPGVYVRHGQEYRWKDDSPSDGAA
jgi:hypothetical protein